MRIPSQFNDSSLYRPRRDEKNGRRRAHVPGGAKTRRTIIRMAVALLFVIVVMREARQPGLYQAFFGGAEDNWVQLAPKSAVLGLPAGETQTPQESNPVAARSENGTSSGGTPSANSPQPLSAGLPDATFWPEAAEWVNSMDVELQRLWVESLVHLKSTHDASPTPAQETDQWKGLSPSQIEQSVNLLYAIDSLTESADGNTGGGDTGGDDEVPESLRQLKNAAQSGQFPISTWDTIRHWARPTLQALDAAALLRVSDGTFWTGRDSDAFYLQLWSGRDLPAEGAVTTGTVPLLQQPEIYRGQTIRLVGSIQLAEWTEAQANRAGIQSYWKLWVIPTDGGIRPTLLITADLPDALRRCIDDDGKWNPKADPVNPDGQVAGIGRFIKRLPYRSSIGADLAPVLIGRIAAMPVAIRSDAASNNGGLAEKPGQEDGGSRAGLFGIVLAIIVGVVFAGILMYRSSADGRRSRQLRQQSLDANEMNFQVLSDGESPSSEITADPDS